ncbi:MAG: hypothetical protein M1839_004662 [Geoglossum umbratile]|nr:MAG: hypothetical protein M1839_004662 [Geoglossum umbratile]
MARLTDIDNTSRTTKIHLHNSGTSSRQGRNRIAFYGGQGAEGPEGYGDGWSIRVSEVIRGLRGEEHPESTNDEIPEDVFEMLSGYITHVLNSQLAVDDMELKILWLELREYTKRKSILADPQSTEERKAHLKRRKGFLTKIESGDWLNLLHKHLKLGQHLGRKSQTIHLSAANNFS